MKEIQLTTFVAKMYLLISFSDHILICIQIDEKNNVKKKKEKKRSNTLVEQYYVLAKRRRWITHTNEKKNYINKMQSKHEIGSAGSFIIKNRTRICIYVHECRLMTKKRASDAFVIRFKWFSFFCLCLLFLWTICFFFMRLIIIYTFRSLQMVLVWFTSLSQWFDFRLRSDRKTLAIIISFHVSTLWR